MAFSTQRAVSDGTLVLLGVSIGYIKQADIAVFYNNIPAPAGTWAWVGATSQISFTPAIANGVEVLLKRTTQIDKVINRFAAGAGFTNQSMDTDFLQMLYLNQEAVEGAALTDIFNDVDFHGKKAKNLGTATLAGDALPKGQYDTLSASLTASVDTIRVATEAVYDNFDDRYLGAKTVAPTLDNDGNSLIIGALYWNTPGATMYAWSGPSWVALPSTVASGVVNTPAGSISAINVQAAINELDGDVTALDAAKAPVAAGFVTGDFKDTLAAAAPSGWVLAAGKTIGNAASGGTERANADTSALFTLLWTNLADAQAPVSGGRGASAAADFAANKTITLPDLRGRARAGKDDMGGTAASRLTAGGSGITGTTLGIAGGAETHTLTIAQMPSHNHASSGGAGPDSRPVGGGTPEAATAGTATGSTGDGGAHNNTQPTFITNVVIKL